MLGYVITAIVSLIIGAALGVFVIALVSGNHN